MLNNLYKATLNDNISLNFTKCNYVYKNKNDASFIALNFVSRALFVCRQIQIQP